MKMISQSTNANAENKQNKERNKTMNKKMLKNTKVGRVVCRLIGEEVGATMMEYVILAVMIAAAVTAAAIYFGNSAKNQMEVAGDAMVGDTKTAENRAEDSRSKQATGVTRANTAAARYKNTTEGDTDAEGGGSGK